MSSMVSGIAQVQVGYIHVLVHVHIPCRPLHIPVQRV